MEIKNPIKILILRTVNLYRGSGKKPLRGLLRKIYFKFFQAGMKENKRVVSEIDGIKYELNLNQYSELETYYGGAYEPEIVRIIKQYVKSGMTVLDAGARIGLHTFRFKKLVGDNGKVYAFDPDEKTFPTLLRNAKLNNYSIFAENKALSDKNEGKEITLDSYAAAKNLDRLDFVKIDTDGYECQIIKGGLNTLKKFKPVMVIEFNRKSLENGSLEPMVDLLRAFGYSFFQSKSLKEYPDNKSMFDEIIVGGGINVLCKC